MGQFAPSTAEMGGRLITNNGWSRPRLSEMPTWFAVAITCCLIYLGFVIWAQVRFHSYRFALDYVMGARLQIEPTRQLLGPHRAGEEFETTIRLRNHGTAAVTVFGALIDCPCVANRGLPRIIPAGGVVAFPITVRVGTVPGGWRRSVRYLTDDTQQLAVDAELRGEVIAVADPSVPALAEAPQ